MEVIIGETIRIDNPTDKMLAWCGQNLLLDNPEYAKKTRMGFWVGNTPKDIRLYKRIGNTLIIPFGCLLRFPLQADEDIHFKTSFTDPKYVEYGGTDVPLYDYQEKAVEAMWEATYGILQAKAGSGKTQMGIALIKRYGRRALWLTHTIDLLNQSKERAERYIDKSMIGTITAGKVDISDGVTFATVQTLAKQDLREFRDVWDVIIVDECHRVCTSASSTTMFERVLNALAARHKFGLSATVHRADGLIKATYALLGDVAYTVPDEAVEERTVRVGIAARPTGIGLTRECVNTDGTLNYTGMINALTHDINRNGTIVNTIVENKGHSCLILSERVSHLATLRYLLPNEMYDQSAMITGKMTTKRGKEEREEILEEMRQGKLKYLFATYQLAKEGLDIPCLDRLFMATPVKDYAVVAQAIGRIARTADGKENAVCYDFVDAIPYLQRAYKSRMKTYRKENCYFAEE